MLYQEVRHEGLDKTRLVGGKDPLALAVKVQNQLNAWDEEYRRKVTTQKVRDQKQADAEAARVAKLTAAEQTKAAKAAKLEKATQMTEVAQSKLAAIAGVLNASAAGSHVLRWDDLKDLSSFPEPKPSKPSPPRPPSPPELSPAPQLHLPAYSPPQFSFLDKLNSRHRVQLEDQARIAHQKAVAEAKARHENSVAAWERHSAIAQTRHREALKEHAQHLARLQSEYETRLRGWEQRRQAFLDTQAETHHSIDQSRDAYMAGEPDAIADYCSLILTRSEYPLEFDRETRVDFNSETEILIVDFSLPCPEDLPTLKEVRYVQTRDELVETHLSEKEIASIYDELLYQIALRTVHEVLDADVIKAIAAVVFNGWVTNIDASTGKEATACLMSVQVGRQEFEEVNVSEVAAKACFKKLKGLASPQLHSLTPVAPVMSVTREDARFVASREVVNKLDEGFNLAAMNWEDFEHLIRELFEQEFAQGGGEVKVTQASRDGGVDAVAFDPDPIRGGKIVIQAKRYTNVVGVSAVRDLYGTVVNEGATKGVLVTTSDYGPDAHEFARGKPITLLSGANLLHLLDKHGHKARIDLQEAKALQAQEQAAQQRK